MDWKEIDELHDKYLQGETTPEEDNRLQKLLLKNENQLPQAYQPVADYFRYVAYMQQQQSATTEADIRRMIPAQPSGGTIRHLLQSRGWSIAAGLALILSLTVFFYTLEQPEPEMPVAAKVIIIDNEEEAMATLLEALALMSANIRIGQEAAISGMTQFDEANPFTQQQKK
jgi:hypothetical protein